MNLSQRYEKNIAPEIAKELAITNKHRLPKLEKVIVNIGIGTYVAKVNSDYSPVADVLSLITGQKPTLRKARMSVSNFNKLREGQPNGLVVTLRGQRMYDFVEKLVGITLPRTRDFKGISAKSFDGKGNYNVGIRDYTIFPEVIVNDIVRPFSMQVTVVTSTQSDDEARLLLTKMGFPFIKK